MPQHPNQPPSPAPPAPAPASQPVPGRPQPPPTQTPRAAVAALSEAEMNRQAAALAAPPSTIAEAGRRAAARRPAGLSAEHRPHEIPTQPGMPEPIRPRVVSTGVLYPNDRLPPTQLAAVPGQPSRDADAERAAALSGAAVVPARPPSR